MASYQNLYNETNIDANTVVVNGTVTIDGTLDLTNTTIIGLNIPVDNVTIQYVSNILSLKPGGISNVYLQSNSVQDSNIVSMDAGKLTGVVIIPVNNTSTQSTIFYAGNGSAASPCYTLISDPTTGFFKFGSPGIGLSIGGVNSFTFNSSGFGCNVGSVFSNTKFLSGSAGTVGGPIFTFSGDSDTGIYNSTTNELAITAGGTQIAKFNSAGIIAFTGSIYSTNDFYSNGGSQSLPSYSWSGGQNCGMWLSGTNEISFGVNATQIVKINTTGVTILGVFSPTSISTGSISCTSLIDSGTLSCTTANTGNIISTGSVTCTSIVNSGTLLCTTATTGNINSSGTITASGLVLGNGVVANNPGNIIDANGSINITSGNMFYSFGTYFSSSFRYSASFGYASVMKLDGSGNLIFATSQTSSTGTGNAIASIPTILQIDKTGNMSVTGTLTSGQFTSSGNIYTPDGTSLLPSHSFTNKPNTGIFLSNASLGYLGLSSNGAKLFELTGSTVQVYAPLLCTAIQASAAISGTKITASNTFNSNDGSVTAPGYSFTNETNSGFYRVSSNNIGCTINGIQIGNISSNTFSSLYPIQANVSNNTPITSLDIGSNHVTYDYPGISMLNHNYAILQNSYSNAGNWYCITGPSGYSGAYIFSNTGSHDFYQSPTTHTSGGLISSMIKNFSVTNNGNVIAGQQAALSTSATDGFFYLPISAGTPTGTTTGYVGKVGMEYDITNNLIYVYNSGWKAFPAQTRGTYTPTISPGTFTYANQSGVYYRTGNVVQVWIYLSWSAYTSSAGNIQISLPFTLTGGQRVVASSTFYSGLTGWSGQVVATCDAGTNNLVIRQLSTTGSSATSLTQANISSVGDWAFNCTMTLN
jgi:hypothetical protein